MPRHPGKLDAVTEHIGQDNPLTLGEVGEPGMIEPVAENDFVAAAQLEKFMNEVMTIVAHEDNQEGALDVLSPLVNGVNQPILRGVHQKVRRKYVEVLARARSTKYNQRQTDAGDPASLLMVPNSKMTCPFTVIHDPNPNGRAWLEAIMRERA